MSRGTRLIILALVLAGTPLHAFDHSYANYETVLKAFVRNGRVDYSALKSDRAALDAWLTDARAVKESDYTSWSRQQQLAYWINVYNGWFLQIVIDRYPIHGSKVFGISYPENSIQRIPGIWDNVKMTAVGRELSLNLIEHMMLRPFMQDPRVHLALVSASLGGPEIRMDPYRAESIDAQLDDASRAFVNHSSKVKWDDASNTILISQIFEWYWDEFSSAADDSWKKMYSKKQAGAVAFVSRYLPDNPLHTTRAKVAYLKYDWTLNDVQK